MTECIVWGSGGVIVGILLGLMVSGGRFKKFTGRLDGVGEVSAEGNENSPGASMNFGDGASLSNVKQAGGDINETLNKIDGYFDESKKSIEQLIDNSTSIVHSLQSDKKYEYTLDIIFERGPDRVRESARSMIARYGTNGWQFHMLSSDYSGTDGCWLVFKRPV